MIALRPLSLLLMACLLFPMVPTMAQPAGASSSDGAASISDRVASWAAQMKAEAEALRSEGADEAVTTLSNLLKSETALSERLRAAPNVDVMLPDGRSVVARATVCASGSTGLDPSDRAVALA